jgi:hypothetical protein
MTERSKAALMLVTFIVFVCVALGFFLILGSKERQDKIETREKPDLWAGKDDEVVEIVKRCKIPGTKEDVLQLTAGYLEIAKAQGNFIEFEGWYAFQVKDSLYEAGVGYKVNGVSKTAKWDVNLSEKTIKPRNQEAFIFAGNNDLLRY